MIFKTTADAIQAFLAEPAIAVVGVSRSGRKFGSAARRALRDKGYRIYPIHRQAATIDGMVCYRRLADLPEQVGAVLVVSPPAAATLAASIGSNRVATPTSGSSSIDSCSW